MNKSAVLKSIKLMSSSLHVSHIGKWKDSNAVNHDNCEMNYCLFQNLEVYWKLTKIVLNPKKKQTFTKLRGMENHQRLRDL